MTAPRHFPPPLGSPELSWQTVGHDLEYVAPKLTVFEASETNIGDPNVNTVGMDYIWQNMDTTNSNSFTTIRKFTNCDVDVVVL
jgi:hypothetical protein